MEALRTALENAEELAEREEGFSLSELLNMPEKAARDVRGPYWQENMRRPLDMIFLAGGSIIDSLSFVLHHVITC